MAIVRTLTDLVSRAEEISTLVEDTGVPVFIRGRARRGREGSSEMVVMSRAAYERERSRLLLYRDLERHDASRASEQRRSARAGTGQLVRSWLRRFGRS